MGRAARWLRSLLGGGKKSSSDPPPPAAPAAKERKRWGFSKTFKEGSRYGAQQSYPAPVKQRGSYREIPCPPAAVRRASPSATSGSDEQSKHAIAVAAATEAVAEAAVAAAQAAAAVVRLTSSGRTGFAAAAAVKIQAAFRGYLARRALRALKGLVKLQALVRGNIVRRQATETLRCMQALVRVQARARAGRALQNGPASAKKNTSSHPQGPPTPEKFEPTIKAAQRVPPFDNLKRSTSSNPANGEAIDKDKNWLDRWMEERYWDSRETATKVVEIDTGKQHYNRRRRSNQHHHSCSSLGSDPNNRSFVTVPDSPSKGSTTAQQSIQSSSSVEMPSCLNMLEEYGDSMQLYSVPPRPGNVRKGTITPAKSECSRSLFSDCSECPNYMANTESSKAKSRSQSAPRQRLELEKSGSIKRGSMHQQTQRMSSIHWKFNKAYPGSGYLDRLGMPVRM